MGVGRWMSWRATVLVASLAGLDTGCFPDFDHLMGQVKQSPVDAGRPDGAHREAGGDGRAPRGHGAFEAGEGGKGDVPTFGPVAPLPPCSTLGEPQYLKSPAPATSAGFGSLVATDGDLLIVAAPMEGTTREVVPETILPEAECLARPLPDSSPAPGAVYAFERAGTSWRGGSLEVPGKEAIFSAVGGKTISKDLIFALNNFALTSLALTDRWIVVGEAGDGADAHSYRGSVTFFERASPWRAVRKYIEPRTADLDAFGYSFALSGSTLVVGAPGSDAGAPDGGAVYVYGLEGTTPTYQRTLFAPTPQAGAWFGAKVAVSDDWIVVGAPSETAVDLFGSALVAGAAYAFRRSDLGDVQSFPPSASLDKLFGTGIVLDGNTLLISAPGADGCPHGTLYGAAGVVHWYELGPSQKWDERGCISANSDRAGLFGFGLALSRDRLAVAAPFSWTDDPPFVMDILRANNQSLGAAAGLVYLYERRDGGFVPSCFLEAPHTDPCDTFGESVALGGDMLAVGAFGEDGRGVEPSGVGGLLGFDTENGLMDSGAVYLYRLPAPGAVPSLPADH